MSDDELTPEQAEWVRENAEYLNEKGTLEPNREREQFIEDWITANGEQYEKMHLTPRLWAAWVYEQLTKPEPPMGHTFTVVHEARRLKAEGEDPEV